MEKIRVEGRREESTCQCCYMSVKNVLSSLSSCAPPFLFWQLCSPVILDDAVLKPRQSPKKSEKGIGKGSEWVTRKDRARGGEGSRAEQNSSMDIASEPLVWRYTVHPICCPPLHSPCALPSQPARSPYHAANWDRAVQGKWDSQFLR